MKCSYRIYNCDVYRFEMPVIRANMYVLIHGNSALVIDPSVRAEADKFLREAHIKSCTILLTHEHFDHISGVNHLRELFPCQVVSSQMCAERMADPRKNGAAHFDALFLNRNDRDQEEMAVEIDKHYSCEADMTYTGHMELRWEDLTLVMRETPGHSLGSQIIEIDHKWYFTGDSFIPGRAVITRLPGGSKKQYDTITRPYLEAIAPGSTIFPGHGKETSYCTD